MSYVLKTTLWDFKLKVIKRIYKTRKKLLRVW